MKRFYFRFRTMLITFALGLASVFAFHNSLKLSNEVYVNLPKTATGEVIVVFPRCHFEMPFAEGSGAVTRFVSNEGTPIVEKQVYKETERLKNCVDNQNSNEK